MVAVNARIIGDCVLIAGDVIQVCITISAPHLDAAVSVRSSEVCESIAWGSAQVHCICTVNEALVHIPSEKNTEVLNPSTSSTTSFAPWRGEKGRVVLATKPKILFCDLQLLPGQSKSFIFREHLPADAPPSFRGKLVKYTYKVTIGTQKLGYSIHHLRLPIRVIVVQGLSPMLMSSDTEELAPSNPFLHTPQRDNSRQSLQLMQGLSTQKNVSQFNIAHPKGQVVTFTIYKTSFKLGDDIAATFDFSKSQVQCVQLRHTKEMTLSEDDGAIEGKTVFHLEKEIQWEIFKIRDPNPWVVVDPSGAARYSATLQSEEEVSQKSRKTENVRPVVVSYNKIHEVCMSFSHTNFLLTIPLSVTPTFATDIVSLRWSIHFEFVLNIGPTSNKLENPTSPSQIDKEEIWKAPSKLDIETLVWDLPIKILPASPSYLSLAVGGPTSQNYD